MADRPPDILWVRGVRVTLVVCFHSATFDLFRLLMNKVLFLISSPTPPGEHAIMGRRTATHRNSPPPLLRKRTWRRVRKEGGGRRRGVNWFLCNERTKEEAEVVEEEENESQEENKSRTRTLLLSRCRVLVSSCHCTRER